MKYLLVFCGVPSPLLAPRSRYNEIIQIPWICFHFDIIDAEMTLEPELVDGSRVIHSNFLLLGIVSDTHSDMIFAAVAPDIVRHFKPDDENTEVQLIGSFPQGVRPVIFVDGPHFWSPIGRIVFVDTFSFTHFEAETETWTLNRKSS